MTVFCNQRRVRQLKQRPCFTFKRTICWAHNFMTHSKPQSCALSPHTQSPTDAVGRCRHHHFSMQEMDGKKQNAFQATPSEGAGWRAVRKSTFPLLLISSYLWWRGLYTVGNEQNSEDVCDYLMLLSYECYGLKLWENTWSNEEPCHFS